MKIVITFSIDDIKDRDIIAAHKRETRNKNWSAFVRDAIRAALGKQPKKADFDTLESKLDQVLDRIDNLPTVVASDVVYEEADSFEDPDLDELIGGL